MELRKALDGLTSGSFKKSTTHKYISKKRVNGRWVYTYKYAGVNLETKREEPDQGELERRLIEFVNKLKREGKHKWARYKEAVELVKEINARNRQKRKDDMEERLQRRRNKNSRSIVDRARDAQRDRDNALSNLEMEEFEADLDRKTGVDGLRGMGLTKEQRRKRAAASKRDLENREEAIRENIIPNLAYRGHKG